MAIKKALLAVGELPTGYSPAKHKLLEAEYREAFQNHLKARDLANEAIRVLRAAERRVSSAAQAFVDHTQLKMALFPDQPEASPTAATAAPATPARGDVAK